MAIPGYIQIDHSLAGLKTFANTLHPAEPVFILTDSNTHTYCLPLIQELDSRLQQAVVIEIPAGEKTKNPEYLFYVLDQFLAHRASRKSTCINLGGGMVCDLGGFASSIFKRGISCVHVPTSLLAQLDASMGGKTGVDFKGFKNLLGTFYPPQKVFISHRFLSTLPEREKRNGLAEALKHALIADKTYWDLLKTNPFAQTELLIKKSIEIKGQFITVDPFEKNERKKLNAGHTIGHALESWKLDTETPILHGEAVAAGLCIEAFISHQLGYMHTQTLAEITEIIFSFFPKINMEGYSVAHLLGLMQQDKKNESGKISLSLIREIGRASFDDYCDNQVMEDALTYYAGL
jgi:3-dehydroquinate synthase